MTTQQKIEILQRDNARLRKEIEKITSQHETDIQNIVKQYKDKQDELIENIRKIKIQSEKELWEFQQEKLDYEKKMKEYFNIKKPRRRFLGRK